MGELLGFQESEDARTVYLMEYLNINFGSNGKRVKKGALGGNGIETALAVGDDVVNGV